MRNDTTNVQNGQMMPILASEISMSSKEISDLLNIRHDNVVRTIKRLATLGTIALPQIEEKSTGGRPITIYIFSGEQGKRDSIVVVAQLSPEVTAKLVDRWQELENNQQALPQDYPSALRALADKEEEKLRIASERDKAIATKGQISRNREAVVMGRLGAKTKENKRLKEQLGVAETYKQAKAIGWLDDYFILDKVAYQQIGKKLTQIATAEERPPIEVEDTKYGKVKAYHIEVITSFKDKLDSDCDLLAKYRKEVSA